MIAGSREGRGEEALADVVPKDRPQEDLVGIAGIAPDAALTRIVLLLCAAVVSLLLYWQTIRCFFVFDDLSIIRFAWVEAESWTDCFRWMSNGFWRPGVFLLGRTLVLGFGLTPAAFHLTSILLHALVCLLTFDVALRLYKGRLDIALIAAVMAVGHVGAWHCVSQFQNMCDLLLTVFILCSLLAWDGYASTGRVSYLLLTVLCQIGAITAKETGIVVPALLFLWLLQSGAAGRKHYWVVGLFCVACAVYAVVSLGQQRAVNLSYQSTGKVSWNPKDVLRQGADYMMSAFLPYLNTITSPIGPLLLPHWVRWMLRLLTAAGIVWAIWSLARKPGPGAVGFPVLACAACLTLPSLLNMQPQGRMLYCAIPFASIFLARAAVMAGRARRPYVVAILVGIWAWFLMGLFWSPDVKNYREMTRRVEQLVEEMKKESPKWKPGATVVILDHPHPGVEPSRWMYCQHLVAIFLRRTDITIVLEATPQASAAYRFVNGSLVPETRADGQSRL